MDTDLMAVNVWNTNSFKLFSKKIFLKLLNYYEREMYLIPSLNIFLCDFLLFFCNYSPNFFPPVTLYPPSLPGPRPRGQPGSPPWLSTWLVLRPDSGPWWSWSAVKCLQCPASCRPRRSLRCLPACAAAGRGALPCPPCESASTSAARPSLRPSPWSSLSLFSQKENNNNKKKRNPANIKK